MRVIATHIETYILMRDQLSFNFLPAGDESMPPSPAAETALNGHHSQTRDSLRDSLWTFTGDKLHMWSDIQEVLRMALEGPALKEEVALLDIPVDFYPLSILLNKGVVLGVESELLQRRDVTFSLFKFGVRNNLFIQYLLRHQLSQQDTPAALAISHQYGSLSYYPHALEVLLHEVLDDEVDNPPNSSEGSLLPAVLNFLQSSVSQATYLDIILQCTRKTELRSWRTLFAHLPPPLDLFEQAIELEELKIAAGYLLILQGVEAEESDTESQHHLEEEPQQPPSSDPTTTSTSDGPTHSKTPSTSSLFSSGRINIISLAVRILQLGKQKCDWEICTELANFLMALDPHGNALNRVMREVGFFSQSAETPPASRNKTPSPLGLTIPERTRRGLGGGRRAASSNRTLTVGEGRGRGTGGGSGSDSGSGSGSGSGNGRRLSGESHVSGTSDASSGGNRSPGSQGIRYSTSSAGDYFSPASTA